MNFWWKPTRTCYGARWRTWCGTQRAILLKAQRWRCDWSGSCPRRGEEIVVRVLDSGPGVPDEALQKIFEPFYRLDDARNRQTGGAGLGLSIADRAIRLHGGQLRASNRKEGGLEVEIRIPAAPGFALPAHS